MSFSLALRDAVASPAGEGAERSVIPSETSPQTASQAAQPAPVKIGAQVFSADAPLADVIVASLEEDKASDIVRIDLSDKSAIVDHMIIASATSSRQVASICDKLIDRLKTRLGRKPRAEGLDQGDWALIDAGDAIVHVFRPEVREYYALEKMWAPELAADGAARRRTA